MEKKGGLQGKNPSYRGGLVLGEEETKAFRGEASQNKTRRSRIKLRYSR